MVSIKVKIKSKTYVMVPKFYTQVLGFNANRLMTDFIFSAFQTIVILLVSMSNLSDIWRCFLWKVNLT